MDCRDIQKRLSAYLDGLLSADEKETVDRHLSSCTHCGLFFEELQKARRLVRDVGDLEPPPWLSQKIMTKVREEAEQEESFFKKFLYPFGSKVPLQAIGVVVLAVLAFQVYRTIVPEIGMTPQPVLAPWAEKSMGKGEAPKAVPSPETAASSKRKEEDEGVAIKDKGMGLDRELRQATPVPVPLGEAAPAPEPAAAVSQAQSAIVPGRPDKEGSGVFGKEENPQMRAPAPSGAVASGVAQEAALPMIVVTSGDIPAARKAVGEIITELGGKTIETSEQGGGAIIIVEVAAAKLTALSERVGKLGEVKSTPQVSALAEGPLRLRIEILPQ